MYESMYNYVGTLFAVFSSLFCFLPGFVAGFSPTYFECFSSRLRCLGKNHIRMTRGGSSSNVREGTPVRRSARQAGHSPEPYVPPPPPPPNPPSTEQILRMFEERRNNDLIEILRSVQAMVGQNGNQNGHHSKLSDFQRTNPPNFSQVVDPLDADDWLRTIEKSLRLLVLKKMIKFHLQLIILKALLPYGGKMQKPCGLLMKKSPGQNSRISSGNIISLLEL